MSNPEYKAYGSARMRQDVRDRLSKLIKDIRELRSQIREL